MKEFGKQYFQVLKLSATWDLINIAEIGTKKLSYNIVVAVVIVRARTSLCNLYYSNLKLLGWASLMAINFSQAASMQQIFGNTE